ncbi:MAG: DUF429 domain-containing protein, partial [Planctomycetes bacterium]|nr:DUF429 domain-containing protein [Planctomycetota bacterium]
LACLSLDPGADTPASQVANAITGSLSDPADVAELFRSCERITLENEFIPAETIRDAMELAGRDESDMLPGTSSLETTQDKLLQRRTYDKHGVPSPKAVALSDDGTWSHGVFESAEALVSEHGDARQICIDIPIGLTDGGVKRRKCDELARDLLKAPRAYSVFTTPARPSLAGDSREHASQINFDLTTRKIPIQTWEIMPKIREVDILMSSDPQARKLLIEVHPELSFWALNDQRPMSYPKSEDEGLDERLDVLRRWLPRTTDEIYEDALHLGRRGVGKLPFARAAGAGPGHHRTGHIRSHDRWCVRPLFSDGYFRTRPQDRSSDQYRSRVYGRAVRRLGWLLRVLSGALSSEARSPSRYPRGQGQSQQVVGNRCGGFRGRPAHRVLHATLGGSKGGNPRGR